jgi:trans-2-enoyl-CoA reductase
MFGQVIINDNVHFTEQDLYQRKHEAIEDIKILLPLVEGFQQYDLETEYSTRGNTLVLDYYLKESTQGAINFSHVSIYEVKNQVLNALKQSQIKINLCVLDDASIYKTNASHNSANDSQTKALIKRRKDETVKFILFEQEYDLFYPHHPFFRVEDRLRKISFKIASIHKSGYMNVKIISDEFEERQRKKIVDVLIKNKIKDDNFYFRLTAALRNCEKVSLLVKTYIDSIDERVLVYEAIS